MWSTTTSRARRRSRSTCCTGIPTPPACRRPITPTTCAIATSRTISPRGRRRSTAFRSISARSRSRSTISPPGRTTSRRRNRSISAHPSSAGRCGSCCRAPAISPAWSTRPARRNINTGPATRRRATTSTPGSKKATEHPGSWWTDWLAWLKAQDSAEVPAREPGGGVVKPIEDAPGSYVKVRS